jgi:hypothetical protein
VAGIFDPGAAFRQFDTHKTKGWAQRLILWGTQRTAPGSLVFNAWMALGTNVIIGHELTMVLAAVRAQVLNDISISKALAECGFRKHSWRGKLLQVFTTVHPFLVSVTLTLRQSCTSGIKTCKRCTLTIACLMQSPSVFRGCMQRLWLIPASLTSSCGMFSTLGVSVSTSV